MTMVHGRLAASLNGTAPRSKGKPKAGPTVPAQTTPHGAVKAVAAAGVMLTAGMSALLNGYHYAQQAPSAWAGWGLGAAVPVLILIMGRVWAARKGRLAGIVAMIGGLGLLVLSVGHCAASIGAVTGSSMWLAIPLAVAVDCGLVACELALMDE